MAITSAFIMMGGFFLVGVYVAGALGVLSLILMYVFSDAPLWNIMGNKAWETNTNFILIAIPLFLLMGELMLRSGLGDRMYSALSRWLTFLPGGLIHTNIASCAIFAACSGSSVATSATISRFPYCCSFSSEMTLTWSFRILRACSCCPRAMRLSTALREMASIPAARCEAVCSGVMVSATSATAAPHPA
ncbi:MAG: TRAP transporter large permease subunit, partial [Bacteroidetes bacterium]|nr:TRAP transporter large permease subunit [Bacteroidota bacterium]